ncbi:MAG TPA: superoxide dismutase family protein [Longimicrobiaceae bacterium]|nr:superoxide dismutase family protein [Longimicrobiaceae bacterium]
MSRVQGIAVVFLAVLPAACRQPARTSVATTGTATAVMRSAQGATLGTLRFNATGAGVRVAGTLAGLPPGVHGIHFHQVGRCYAPDFATAGGHLNPTGALHGLQNPLGPHAGDLPNLTVAANGEGEIETVARGVTLRGTNPLLKPGGTALVIHASADDNRTDPAGNSGVRIACGVIRESSE